VANFRQLKQVGVFFFFSGKFPHCGGDKKKEKRCSARPQTSVVQRISCGKNVPKSPDFEEKNSEIALFNRDNVGGAGLQQVAKI